MSDWFRTATRFDDHVGAKRIATYLDILRRFPPGRLVDLGAGHGIFSRIAADLGWRVTAVDARAERFGDDPSIDWVVADVREYDDYDDADLVICFGLWYHLTLDDQIALAARVAPRPFVLDTHVATATLPTYQLPNERFISDVGVHRGLTGRWYDESEFQSRATASWGNEASFWPSVASLQRQLLGAGYEMFEQISPPYLPDRGFFVAHALADGLERSRLDEIVGRHDHLTNADAAPAPDAVAPTLTPELAVGPPPARPTVRPTAQPSRPAAPRVPPVRVAARQLATSVRRSVRARLGH